MIYKDLITLIIVFLIILVLGLRIAEEGVYSTMGLDVGPRSFAFEIRDDRSYGISILGKKINLRSVYRIGDFYADRGRISIEIAGRKYSFCPMVKAGFPPMRGHNLDKNFTKMYN
ncbi:histidine kinase [Thermoanaerobacterium sp. DL9XJH110]|uniref:histidine kinase n=1 Tax=Thermoanaerobacterium sp. DL9XJH110 TaxID=3386643 RepID=UPI003BB6DCEE